MQYVKSGTGGECKSKTLQRVKVQHEIVLYIKESNTKNYRIKIVQYEESAT